MKTAIHVAVSLDFERYKPEYDNYVATLFVSILENTKASMNFHIMYIGVVPIEFSRLLNETMSKYDVRLVYHKIYLNKEFYGLKGSEKWSPAIANRFYLANILVDIDKVIFLDVDIVFKGDIREIWEIPLRNFLIAGVHFSDMDRIIKNNLLKEYHEKEQLIYWVNGGVIIYNLGEIRGKISMIEEAKKFVIVNPKISSYDELCLNHMFKDNTLIIDAKYNYSVYHLDYERESNEFKKEIVCIHFADRTKPLHCANGTVDYYFWKYFQMTPYFTDEYFKQYFIQVSDLKKNVEYIGDFYNSYNRQKKIIMFGTGDYAESVADVMSKNNYIIDFFVDNDVDKQSVYFRKKPCKSPEELKRMSDGYIVLIAIHGDACKAVKEQLSGMGLIEKKDFFEADIIYENMVKFQ